MNKHPKSLGSLTTEGVYKKLLEEGRVKVKNADAVYLFAHAARVENKDKIYVTINDEEGFTRFAYIKQINIPTLKHNTVTNE